MEHTPPIPKPPNSARFLTVILLVLLSCSPSSEAPRIPIPEPEPINPPEQQFTVLDCLTDNLEKVSLSSVQATTYSECRSKPIYLPPTQKKALLVQTSPFYPLSLLNCKISIKMTGMTCGSHGSINARNSHMINNILFSKTYSSSPETCWEANNTQHISIVSPPYGSYPGQKIQVPLQNGTGHGIFWPFDQNPSSIGCTGFFLIDEEGLLHFNAALRIEYFVTINTIPAKFDISSGKFIINNKLMFKLADANKYKSPSPNELPKRPLVSTAVATKDIERINEIDDIMHFFKEDEIQNLFPQGMWNSNEEKSIAILTDQQKQKVFDRFRKMYHTNISANQVQVDSDRWYRSPNILTYWNDHEEGLYITLSESIPTDLCDTSREIVSIKSAEFFESNRTGFQNIIRFTDSQKTIGLGAFLGKQTTLCTKPVFKVAQDVYIQIIEDSENTMSLPKVSGSFLRSQIQEDMKLLSLTVSSTLNLIALTGNVDSSVCEIDRTSISNKMSLILGNMQELTDEAGTALSTFQMGETLYFFKCRQVEAIARDFFPNCCQEMPVYIKDRTNHFTVKSFMLPISRKLASHCTTRQCSTVAPAYYNLSSEGRPNLFYRILNGTPEITDTIPSEITPRGLINTDLEPTNVNEIYDPNQLQELQYYSERGSAQNSITAVITNSILKTMNEPFNPLIIPSARASQPNGIINAATQLFNFSPFQRFIATLPHALQSAMSVATLMMTLWIAVKAVGLLVAFCAEAKANIRNGLKILTAPGLVMNSLYRLKAKQIDHQEKTTETIEAIVEEQKNIQQRLAAHISYVLKTLKSIEEKQDSKHEH